MPLPHITMLLRCSSALINAYAMPNQSTPLPVQAVLNHSFAMPKPVWAMHFHCFSTHCHSTPLLNYAVPLRISTPLLHSGSTPCHTTATPDLAMPSRLNAPLSRRDTLRSHASPVPSYSLPRPCHAEQFPCVTLIRPAIAVHSYAMATHNHAITKQCLTLPPQFQADRIYAIAFLCFAIRCHRTSVLNHSIRCLRRSQPVYAATMHLISPPCRCNSVQGIATAQSAVSSASVFSSSSSSGFFVSSSIPLMILRKWSILSMPVFFITSESRTYAA